MNDSTSSAGEREATAATGSSAKRDWLNETKFPRPNFEIQLQLVGGPGAAGLVPCIEGDLARAPHSTLPDGSPSTLISSNILHPVDSHAEFQSGGRGDYQIKKVMSWDSILEIPTHSLSIFG